MTSNHYKNERYRREIFIQKHLKGDGNVIDSFVVDKGHPNGVERHEVTDHGIVLIYNNHTNVLCSKLIARPAQIKRYYRDTDRKPPRWLLRMCYRHQMKRYNK